MTRWDALFADLEAQAEQLADAERAGEVEDRARGEVATLRVVDRLRPVVDGVLRLQLTGSLWLSGRLLRVGAGWLLLDEGAGREAVVSLPAVLTVGGVSRYSTTPGSEGRVASRLGLQSVLRGVVRDRSPARVHLIDGSVVDGTLDRAGADFLELAVHEAGGVRRAGNVRELQLVPLTALAAVRRAG